jgi:glycosyltransferase involved in cell wall biosynthesis
MPVLFPENIENSDQDYLEVRKVSICIVSHNGYGAITGGKGGGFVGGVERQTSLLAKWLAVRGHEVSFLTWDEGGPQEEVIDGVRVIKICRQDAGFPGLRFFHPKWSGLLAALRKADADVYYHNCGECVTGQISVWCHRNGRSFVFSAASEADCDPALPELSSHRERWLYLHGLRQADQVIVQTRTQQEMMARNFQVEAIVIPMPAPGPVDDVYQAPSAAACRVLWVGRVCKVKRPDRLVEIAKACPELHFDVAGPIYDDDFSRAAAAEAGVLPNVTMHGAVSRDAIPGLYRAATLLCCTSDYEGFPNTFLEAWSHGLPVVSTVDPDGVIAREDLGRVASDTAALTISIRGLVEDPAAYATSSKATRQYFLEHHAMESVMPRFETVFTSLARPRGIHSSAAER